MTTCPTTSTGERRLSPRRRTKSPIAAAASPPPNWMLPFYKKQHLILLALPLAIGTFLSLHQSFLVSDSTIAESHTAALTAALSSALPLSILEEEDRNRPSVNFGVNSGDDNDDDFLPPKIAWLLSYPNSGTSYTMTMVEEATNRSTATNYGVEVTDTKYPSVPVHANHPEGPYWEGTSVGRRLAPGKDRYQSRIRALPDTFVLTKTHCGGRCVRCGATEYGVPNTTTFLRACARTTARLGKNVRVEAIMDPTRVERVVHLIRNPFTNIVARFHLEGRNMIQRDDVHHSAATDSGEAAAAAATTSTGRARELLPMNATGFATFCRVLDNFYVDEEDQVFSNNPRLVKLMRQVPCRAEFYKYVQWHNYVGKILASLGPETSVVAASTSTSTAELNHDGGHLPVLTLYYENFHSNIEVTSRQLLDFLQQEQYYHSENDASKIRPFRDLPTYDDHFSAHERQAAKELMRTLATPWTWERIRRYLE